MPPTAGPIPSRHPSRSTTGATTPVHPARRLAVAVFLGVIAMARAATVNPDELAESHRWATARFASLAGPLPAVEPIPALYLQANHDAVQKNGRHGQPMKLGTQSFNRGLYCHAPSRILVRLPAPGRTFTALAGIDSNEQTGGGRGSVEFSVRLGEAEPFKSAVMREGMPPQRVEVDLQRAVEFVLEVNPTPDGIACDQADWAEARVTLEDGRELWVADLTLIDERPFRLFATAAPFSFTYGGRPSAQCLAAWPVQRTSRTIRPDSASPHPRGGDLTEQTLVWTDPATGLEVRCVAIEYHRFPTVEWTLFFRNTSSNATPILESLQALDVQLDRGDTAEFLLHHHRGSLADGNDYGPLETPLPPGQQKRLGGQGGRPTNADWSYVNLEWPHQGLILAVGWPGQWAAQFTRDAARGLEIRAGQELTRFKLLPGEEIRSPLIALQFYKGDRIRAQNVWRRWMQAHSMPTPGGALPPPQFVASSSRQYDEMIRANETNQIAFIDRYLAERLKLDYWWMDAGWYEHHGGGWPRVGTWLVDSNRFPRGLRAVSDHAHQQNIKIIVWFEPERVTAGTWLALNRPEWVLGGGNGGLLNLGDENARRWLTDHIDALITEQGIDLYRQDFNMDPLDAWRKNDAPDRQGITENHHVTGLLAFWDELRRRHPNLLIDACASGGRRNDLESMRRAVPLWRSDYAYEPTGHQCMTHGVSLWLPYHGTGTVAARNAAYYGSGKTPVEPYAFWSNVTPSLGFGIDMRVPDLDYEALRQLVARWRQMVVNFAGDYYPLTGWTRDTTLWIAWQFDRPETGHGMVQAFRRENSAYESARFQLRGLDPNARYSVRPLDPPNPPSEFSGRELLEQGVPIAIPNRPGAVVLLYTKTPAAARN